MASILMLAGMAGGGLAIGWPAGAQVPGVTTPTVTTETTLSLLTIPTLPPLTTETTVATTIPPTISTTMSTVVSTVSTVVSTASSVVSSVTVPSLPVSTTLPAGVDAQTVIDCTDFLTQQAAQLALNADKTLATILDGDADGLACELLPSVAPTGPGSPTGPQGNGGSGTSVSNFTGAAQPASSPSGGTGSSGSSSTEIVSGAGTPVAGSTGATGRNRGTSAGPRSSGERPLDGAEAIAADAPLGFDAEGGGVRHVVLKVIAFLMLLGVTAAAAANRELLIEDLVAVRS